MNVSEINWVPVVVVAVIVVPFFVMGLGYMFGVGFHKAKNEFIDKLTKAAMKEDKQNGTSV